MVTTLSVVSLDQGRLQAARRASRFPSDAEFEARRIAAATSPNERLFERISRAFGSTAVFALPR